MAFEVVTRGTAVHYCDLPGWKIRRRMHMGITSIIRCKDCGLYWQYQYRGIFDLLGGWVPINDPPARPRRRPSSGPWPSNESSRLLSELQPADRSGAPASAEKRPSRTSAASPASAPSE